MDDVQHVEAGLLAIAEAEAVGAGVLRALLFERFFAALPDRRATFYNVEAASLRMTDETLQMIHGLAIGEPWVAHMIDDLVATHRAFGPLPFSEYEVFVALLVDSVRDLAIGQKDDAWPDARETAWRRQAARLLERIGVARAGWSAALPD